MIAQKDVLKIAQTCWITHFFHIKCHARLSVCTSVVGSVLPPLDPLSPNLVGRRYISWAVERGWVG